MSAPNLKAGAIIFVLVSMLMLRALGIMVIGHILYLEGVIAAGIGYGAALWVSLAMVLLSRPTIQEHST